MTINNTKLSTVNICLAGESQKRLLKRLFENYNPLERPVEDDTSTLNVRWVEIFIENNNINEFLKYRKYAE